MSAKGLKDGLIANPAVQYMGEKNRQVYFDAITRASEAMDNSMCYVLDWVPEPMPLENIEGSSIEMVHNNRISLAGTGDTPGEYVSQRQNWAPQPSQRVLVFPDSYGYCTGILERAPKGRVGRCEVAAGSPKKHTKESLKELLAPGWDLIIFACGIDTPADNQVSSVIRHQSDVTQLYMLLLQALISNPSGGKQLVCITCDVFAHEAEIHEEVGVGLVACSNLWGLSNSARLELDGPLHYIDTEWALLNETMPFLASEVFRVHSFGKDTVRILNAGRYVARQIPSKRYEQRQQPFKLPMTGIIALSGGNGALAMVMSMWILDTLEKQGYKGGRGKVTVKLLSRSMKVGDDLMPKWKAVQEKGNSLGVAVEQCKCDVSKADAVSDFIAQCTPDLVGFIHAAGVLQDGMLYTQTWERFEAVFDPKCRAALYIHDALERHRNPGLEFYWMFSSTSVFGNAGASNYSSANSYLDALARHRCAMGKPGLAINWSSWAEVGMAANAEGALRDRLFNSPQPPFSNEEGIGGMLAGLSTGMPVFSVLKWNTGQIFMSTFAGDTPTQCFNRNWLSMMLPLPPMQLGGNSDTYTVYCREFGRDRSLLLYDTYIDPIESQ
mmetsp:Transcript_118194/g.335245  ORF Transcript_118194/g.335245 Transcript_118194/m.335245 type:complete len:609 (-) Transcript_118194:74-1900(-)